MRLEAVLSSVWIYWILKDCFERREKADCSRSVREAVTQQIPGLLDFLAPLSSVTIAWEKQFPNCALSCVSATTTSSQQLKSINLVFIYDLRLSRKNPGCSTWESYQYLVSTHPSIRANTNNMQKF